MTILISACLLGTPCRYDGQSKPCAPLEGLQTRHKLLPVCPEVAGGLCTPRLPAERQGSRVVRVDGVDVTDAYRNGAHAVLELARQSGARLAILKEKSPSCGKGQIYDGSFSRLLIEGDGVTAELLQQHGIEVITESEAQKRIENGLL